MKERQWGSGWGWESGERVLRVPRDVEREAHYSRNRLWALLMSTFLKNKKNARLNSFTCSKKRGGREWEGVARKRD